MNDAAAGGGNEISLNDLHGNGIGRTTGAISLEDVSETDIHHNHVGGQESLGYALRAQGGPHTHGIQVEDNRFQSEDGKLFDVAEAAQAGFLSDHNSFYTEGGARFLWGSGEQSFVAWQQNTGQDLHSQMLAAEPSTNTGAASVH